MNTRLTRLIICAASIVLVSSTHAAQSFVCDGTVLLHPNKVCSNIQFNLVLDKNSLQVSHHACLQSIKFDKMRVDKDNDLRMEFSYQFVDEAAKVKMLEDFTIDKATGEFGLGRTNMHALGVDKISIGGFCKLVKNVVD